MRLNFWAFYQIVTVNFARRYGVFMLWYADPLVLTNK